MKPETLAKIAVAYSGLVWGLFWIPVRAKHGAGVHGSWGSLLLHLIPGLPIAPARQRELKVGQVTRSNNQPARPAPIDVTMPPVHQLSAAPQQSLPVYVDPAAYRFPLTP